MTRKHKTFMCTKCSGITLQNWGKAAYQLLSKTPQKWEPLHWVCSKHSYISGNAQNTQKDPLGTVSNII